MRQIDEVILHCTATPWQREVDIEEIRRWHTQGNKWADVGYHYLIQHDGCLQVGRQLEVAGAHTKGHNSHSVGVAYAGGIKEDGSPGDTMTPEQEETFEHLFFALQLVLGKPLLLSGHNDYNEHKSCPGFKVSEKWANSLQL